VAVWTLIVLLLMPETIPESITGYHFLQPNAVSIGRRMGLERAYGPFDHPILLGCFCATTLGLSWYVLAGNARLPLGRLVRLGGVIVSAIMSVSSGTVAFLAVQLIGIVWDGLTRKIPRRWWILLGILAALYIAVDFTSTRTPLTVAMYYLTFSPETAYGRMAIWDYGTLEVQRHPLFGIGNNSWEHPTWISDSIDNFWLATAMMYGIPAILTLGGALLSIGARLMKRKNMDVATASCRMGWLVSFAGLVVAGSTVYFWNSSLVAIMLFFGSAVWMVEGNPKARLRYRRQQAWKTNARELGRTGGTKYPSAGSDAARQVQ
jgi:O-antigen ligase